MRVCLRLFECFFFFCVCLCGCVCVCVLIFSMCKCACVCICIYLDVCQCACVYVCACVCVRLFACVCVCVCPRSCFLSLSPLISAIFLFLKSSFSLSSWTNYAFVRNMGFEIIIIIINTIMINITIFYYFLSKYDEDTHVHLVPAATTHISLSLKKSEKKILRYQH